MDPAEPPQTQICACIEYIGATPFAWPKNETIKNQIRNLTGYMTWMEERMRVDRFAVILQTLPQSNNVIYTLEVLKYMTEVWIQSENATDTALGWKATPVFSTNCVHAWSARG